MSPLKAEGARIEAHAAAVATWGRRVAHLPVDAARLLAFHVISLLLRQLTVGAPGPVVRSRLLDVRLLRDAFCVAIDLDSAHKLAEVHREADRLHSRLFGPSQPHDRWPAEARYPAEAAQAIRRATAPDPRPLLGLLLHDAHALLTDACLDADAITALVASAEREATIAGLEGLVQEAAEQDKPDVVLLALHVACGAQATAALRAAHEGAMRPIAEQLTAEERAWIDRLRARRGPAPGVAPTVTAEPIEPEETDR